MLQRFSYDLESENARTKQKQQTTANRAIWLVYRADTNARGFWLVKRTLGWKNFMPENFLEINRYFALTSYCNTIGQSNNVFSILGFSLAGKRRGHVLFHWLIKQITNTYLNHFSRSYENRYMICGFLGDIHIKMTWLRLFSHGTGRISTCWVFLSLGVAFTRNHLNRLKFRRLAVQSSVWTGRKHWKVACELVTEF